MPHLCMCCRSLFDEVNKDSLYVWKWEMYRLVEDFHNKPSLAPPFIIIEDIWSLFKYCFKKLCCRPKERGALHVTFG